MIAMRPLQRFTILVSAMALIVMSFPAPLYGQRVGERLHVTLDGEKMTGTVSATSQSGFDLRLWGGKSRSVVHSEVELLERSLGTQTYMVNRTRHSLTRSRHSLSTPRSFFTSPCPVSAKRSSTSTT